MKLLNTKYHTLVKRWGKIPIALTLTAILLLVAVAAVIAAEYIIAPPPAGETEHEVNGAWFMLFNTDDATGTGLFNPFVRVSANKEVVQGYNTNYRPLQFDESASWTDAIKLSEIPYILYEDVLYREFQLDLNQTNANPYISLDEVQIWLGGADAATITGFEPGATITDFGSFPGYTLQQVYNMDADEDNHIKLDASLSAGSGKRDLRLLVPDAFFEPYDEECAYLGTGCEQYMVFYTKFGIAYPNNDGFEEWGVAIYNVAKGFKWHDLNANGIWDAAEPPLSGWLICAQEVDKGTDVGDPICQMTKTDGSYTLPLPNGNYRIYETCLVDWLQSYPTPIAGVCGSGVHTISVKNGQVVENLNFGNYTGATKTGMKFHDMNANGVKDSGDGPIAGVPIEIWQGGVKKAETTTDALGVYTFSGLMPGSYLVCEKPPAPWVQSYPKVGDPGTGACPAGYGPVGWSITLTSGQTDSGNDFGNYKPATKTGMKFEDMNANGVKDAGDNAVAGVPIEIWQGGSMIAETTTNASGVYTFSGLKPGSYLVCEKPPAPWVQSYPKVAIPAQVPARQATARWVGRSP